jgi:hypothetical protein
MAPRPTRIFHITHIDNLASILQTGELLCINALRRTGARWVSIAYPQIQERRALRPVPCGPGGTVHDYVPFFLGPRPPMLYAVHTGQVAGCREGQSSVIYLVSTAQSVRAAGLRFVFTDGHSVNDLTEFFDDLAHLDRVDWLVLRSRLWHNTPQDPDRKRRRQAEFLVHRSCPWWLIQEIGVIDTTMQQRVERAIAHMGHKPAVTVAREWYY